MAAARRIEPQERPLKKSAAAANAHSPAPTAPAPRPRPPLGPRPASRGRCPRRTAARSGSPQRHLAWPPRARSGSRPRRGSPRPRCGDPPRRRPTRPANAYATSRRNAKAVAAATSPAAANPATVSPRARRGGPGSARSSASSSSLSPASPASPRGDDIDGTSCGTPGTEAHLSTSRARAVVPAWLARPDGGSVPEMAAAKPVVCPSCGFQKNPPGLGSLRVVRREDRRSSARASVAATRSSRAATSKRA